MKFRLNKIQIENENYQTDDIELVNQKSDKSSNHFSLIVGNNGTGKSRLLGSITRVLNGNFKSRNSDLFYFSNFQTTGTLSKIISVSNSLSDKFPLDNSIRVRETGFNYRDEKYNYLGTRGRMGASSRTLIRRAIDILLENYANKNVSKCYRHVFDYLDYHPIIKLEYTIIHREITNIPTEEIRPLHLIDYINKKASYSGLNGQIFNSIEERYGDRFNEVCDFLNMLKNQDLRKYELEIDFSTAKIRQIDKNNKLYEEELRIYEILNILRKLNMIRGFDVNLVKKGNSPFNFSDASSGEANILTTLIALIPLVEDNCCVLIDEPELSLHPSWQYRYIELLNKIFENFNGCHIIIASHSHFIVSDLQTNNSSVITLKKENGIVFSNLLPESTFGWSAEDILLNVFDLPTTRNYYVSALVSETLDLIGKNKKRDSRFKELKEELIDLSPKLKNEDPLKLIIKSILEV